MTLRYGFIVLLLAGGTALAQEKPVPEERSSQQQLASKPSVGDPRLEAVLEAVRQGRFEDADQLLMAEQVHPDSLWPTPRTYIAVRLLAGQSRVLDRLDGERWRETLEAEPVWYGHHGGGPWYDRLDPRLRAALRLQGSDVTGGLRQRGATDEELAFGLLLRDWFVPQNRIELNRQADSFLDLFPETRFESFVREEIGYESAIRYGLGLDLGFGIGTTGSALGTRFGDLGLSGHFAVRFRFPYGHVALGGFGADFDSREGLISPEGPVPEDRDFTFLHAGVEFGPRFEARVSAVRFEVLPLVGLGRATLNDTTTPREESDPDYDLPGRLAFSYGVRLFVGLNSDFVFQPKLTLAVLRSSVGFGESGSRPVFFTFGYELGLSGARRVPFRN